MHIYFESTLVPEDNREKRLIPTNNEKILVVVMIINCYKLICVDNESSKLFKIYLGKETVKIYTNNMIENNKYCSGVIENILTMNL